MASDYMNWLVTSNLGKLAHGSFCLSGVVPSLLACGYSQTGEQVRKFHLLPLAHRWRRQASFAPQLRNFFGL
jgi:hypothetical protein